MGRAQVSVRRSRFVHFGLTPSTSAPLSGTQTGSDVAGANGCDEIVETRDATNPANCNMRRAWPWVRRIWEMPKVVGPQSFWASREDTDGYPVAGLLNDSFPPLSQRAPGVNFGHARMSRIGEGRLRENCKRRTREGHT
jgi:hypothetical protein